MNERITDLDELIREVDRLAERREWQELDELRIGARKAFESGHQLWPAGDWAAYRLAREAGAMLAAKMVNEDAARFAMGPLTEVIASTHTWTELEPHLDAGPTRAAVFVERLLRGEQGEPPDDYALHLAAPSLLCDWEPEYLLAAYHLDRVEVPELPLAALASVQLPESQPEAGDPQARGALEQVVAHWRHQADIPIRTSAVEGSAVDAIAQVAVDRSEIGLAEVDTTRALQYMSFVGAASGRATGRRGAAAAREAAVAALLAVAGLDDAADPQEIGSAATELRWYFWDDGSPSGGFSFRIAAEDPQESLAWAVSAILPPLDASIGT
jgi:hypothetical protein